MCGFSGFLSPNLSVENGYNVLCQMGDAIKRRGPDAEGIWQDEKGEIGFIHKRLAIFDLSSEANQPFLSPSKRYVLAFNGEIYNHKEIRSSLIKDGLNFKTSSDTEVLLVCLEYWGVEKTLKKCIGMFAFALWDRREKVLTLARDRFGEKPLYYGWQGRSFLFGSSLNALGKHPDWIGSINKNALSLLIQHNFIPTPHSIFEQINKLEPGTWLELQWQKNKFNEKTYTYWSANEMAKKGTENTFSGNLEEATDELESLIEHSVNRQSLGDVPIGAFLSGGVDSSTIVAMLQKQSTLPIKTFNIGFEDSSYDESSAAESIASFLGTNHTKYILSDNDILNFIPQINDVFDEPFADASFLPTALVSKLARKDVKVALSGDGGDEIFGGYNRYFFGKSVQKSVNIIPEIIRKGTSKGIKNIKAESWEKIIKSIPFFSSLPQGGEKFHKLADVIIAESDMDIYTRLTSFWLDGMPISKSTLSKRIFDENIWQLKISFEEKMMIADTLFYLPDDILVKVDRCSMASSLETRSPFLDHRVFEFAWSLPQTYKISRSNGKKILKEVLFRHIPKNLIERPKTGFALPIGDFLRGPLRDWAETLLSVEHLSKSEYFDVKKVREVWAEHISGKANRQYDLLSILMFQTWLAK